MYTFRYRQSAPVSQWVLHKRLWRRDAALRTVPTTDRKPSEASVPTAACLATYLSTRPWIRSARRTKPARQPMGKRVRGGKKELTARMKETRHYETDNYCCSWLISLVNKNEQKRSLKRNFWKEKIPEKSIHKLWNEIAFLAPFVPKSPVLQPRNDL